MIGFRYLIESLQRSYLISERAQLKTLDTPSKETTPFNQIFGGYMRQDVTCLRCKYISTTFQHFMDLLLDIRQVSNIEDALQQHFKQERIGGNGENADSMYKCEKCHVKVPAKNLVERCRLFARCVEGLELSPFRNQVGTLQGLDQVPGRKNEVQWGFKFSGLQLLETSSYWTFTSPLTEWL